MTFLPSTVNRILAGLLTVVSLACTDSPETLDQVPESNQAAGEAGSVRDAAGVDHVPTTLPARIISLVPSATETLVAIGAIDLIVARTDYDELPELSGLPSIGAGLQPNLEAILAQAPDLVIYFYGASEETTPRRLRDAGIQTFGVRPDRIEDVRKTITDLGAITGHLKEATTLLSDLDASLAEVSARIAGLPRVQVVFTLGEDPPWVAGPGSYISELITVAGGDNVFADVGSLYGPASLEQFLVREIDIVLTTSEGELPEQISRLGVIRLPAFVEVPGPRLHLAASAIARALHPDVFP